MAFNCLNCQHDVCYHVDGVQVRAFQIGKNSTVCKLKCSSHILSELSDEACPWYARDPLISMFQDYHVWLYLCTGPMTDLSMSMQRQSAIGKGISLPLRSLAKAVTSGSRGLRSGLNRVSVVCTWVDFVHCPLLHSFTQQHLACSPNVADESQQGIE